MAGVQGTCVVVGGFGFLGGHIVEKLLEQGWTVRVFDVRVPSDPSERSKLTYYQGSICNENELAAAFRGADTVFHCASPQSASNNKKLFYSVNVEGTNCLLRVCQRERVKCLVLTSSASVVYSGYDIVNGSEELPYAQSPLDYYTQTKILQEKLVLEADGVQELHTVAIRPHGIFGPRDVQTIPTAVDMARKGKMKFILGNGENLVDFTFVDNVVHGHILAAEAVLKGNSAAYGQAYNITNNEPVRFWDFLSDVLNSLGYERPRIHLPASILYFLSLIFAFVCYLLRPIVNINSNFTPFRIAIASTDHFYCSEKAHRDLGYKPVVSFKDGFNRTIESFQHLKNPTQEK